MRTPLPQTLTRYASRFQLMMGLQHGYDVVRMGDESLVYMRGFYNDFDTPLALRGPTVDVDKYLAEVQS